VLYTHINEKLLQERAMLHKRQNIIWIAKESPLHDQMKLHQIQETVARLSKNSTSKLCSQSL